MAPAPHRHRHSPLLDSPDVAPLVAALALSCALIAGRAAGLLPSNEALASALVVWTVVAGWLAYRLHARALRLGSDRRALKALREVQSQYGIAEDLGAFGTWIIDRRGKLFWSGGAFRLFGQGPHLVEPSIREFSERIHADDRRRWINLLRNAFRQGGEISVEYRYLRGDGQTVWIRSIGRAQRNTGGKVSRVAGVAQDITGIRTMQHRLATSEAKFREFTHMSSDWTWETDPDHRWADFSESAEPILGSWIRTLKGCQFWEPGAGSFAFRQPNWHLQRARMTAHAPFEDFEFAVVDPEGNAHFLAVSGRAARDAEGRFVGYRGVGREISREKEQRMLLECESEIATIMREFVDPEKVITDVIVAVCGLLGWQGGANLHRARDRDVFSVGEHWGDPELARVFADLPDDIPLTADSVEARACNGARSAWIPDIAREPGLASRYQAARIGVNAAFLAPILDEHGEVLSTLLFLSKVGFRSSSFLDRLAEILSRNLSLYLQRKAAEQRITYQSLHDALTGLPNRVHLTHRLESILERNEPAAVLYIDLDRYKLINDTLGHSVGDQVLVDVAARLKESIRPEDLAGRIGGDEFILLIANPTSRIEIERVARRVLTAIEKPFFLANQAYYLSASIGVAIAPDDGANPALLIKCADNAMYRVKSEGRNDVRFFTGGMSDERTEQLQLSSELPLALQRNEVDLHYQPILDVAQRSVAGFEALLRWHHPTRGLLTADQFLPVAEQAGLTRELGMWSIRRALDDRVALGIEQFPDAAVSVNVSPRQLADDGLPAALNRLLAERGMPARLLRLELTESAFIENPVRTGALIAELRRLGVHVIIDNFGTGYASLSYLRNLPVDGIKIDQVFIRGLHEDSGNAAIVEAVTTLASRLGLQVMAEGVESAGELKALRRFRCHQMQGALISEPLTLSQLREFLESLPAIREMHLPDDRAIAA